jgi:hypothetical protein
VTNYYTSPGLGKSKNTNNKLKMNPNIATANGLTRGQESAVLIKIAQQLGVENIQMAIEIFLRGTVEIIIKNVLDFVGTVKISATNEKFVAKDKFKLKKDGGICSYIGSNFVSWFLAGGGKIEGLISDGGLQYYKLTKRSVDGPIIEELGGEVKVRTGLAKMFDLMMKQANGGEGALLINGCANIFYIDDISGVLRAVCVLWGGAGWNVSAYSVENPDEWYDGYQVFSRNS